MPREGPPLSSDTPPQSNVVDINARQTPDELIERAGRMADRFRERIIDPETEQIKQIIKKEMADILPHSVDRSPADRLTAQRLVFDRYVEMKYADQADGVESLAAPSSYDGDRGQRFLLGHDVTGEVLGTFGIVMDNEDDPSSIPAGRRESFKESTIPDKVASLQLTYGLRLMEAGQFASANKDMPIPALLKALEVVRYNAKQQGADAVVVQINPRHYHYYMAVGFQRLAEGTNVKVHAPAGLFWLPISRKAEIVQQQMTEHGETESQITHWPSAA